MKPGAYTVHAGFVAGEKTISENRYPLWVYPKELPALSMSVAFINPQESLRSFVKNTGVKLAEPITNGFLKDQVVVVPSGDTTSAQNKARLLQVLAHVKNGGTAIYLNPIYCVRNNLKESSRFFPFELTVKGPTGHWISVSHIVKPHPVFEGLPSGQLMGQEYQNVCALRTITNLNDMAVPVVGSLSWDIGTHINWNYMGPTQAWWGNDMAVVPYGKGKVIRPWQNRSGKVPAMLKTIGTGQLRYPGGTVATFYYWEQPTGQGWADSWNPEFVAAKNLSVTSFMNIDEYLATVQKQHIEPLVGINMGSGMKYNRIEDGIT